MTHPFKLSLLGLALLASIQLGVPAAVAEEFPRRPVRLIVPTEVGGSVDFSARLLADEMSKSWKRGVIVENKAGAGGAIGTEAAAKSEPDGHTICYVSSSFSTNAAVYTKLPYDSVRDFEPITLVATSPWVLVVSAALPVKTVKELLDLAKEKGQRQLTYASTGPGGAIHLATELFNRTAGLNMLHVPYKGAAPGLNDMISGRIDVTITGITGATPHVKTGKLRLLAVTGANRSAAVPDLPTVGETVPGYAYDNWFGALAPRGTPKDVVAQLNAQFAAALKAAEVRKRMVGLGMEPVGSSAEEFAGMIRSEIAKFTKLVKDIGGVAS